MILFHMNANPYERFNVSFTRLTYTSPTDILTDI